MFDKRGMLLAGIAIIGVLGIGSGIAAAAPPPPASAPTSAVQGSNAYQVNARGETYGSDQYARSPAGEPDLILAQATNGVIGYVRWSDVQPTAQKSGANTLQANALSGGAKDVNVYAADGVTVIGVFHIDAGHVTVSDK